MSDWSSYVCSSDLERAGGSASLVAAGAPPGARGREQLVRQRAADAHVEQADARLLAGGVGDLPLPELERLVGEDQLDRSGLRLLGLVHRQAQRAGLLVQRRHRDAIAERDVVAQQEQIGRASCRERGWKYV